MGLPWKNYLEVDWFSKEIILGNQVWSILTQCGTQDMWVSVTQSFTHNQQITERLSPRTQLWGSDGKKVWPRKKKKQKISKEAGTTVSALTYTGVTHNIWWLQSQIIYFSLDWCIISPVGNYKSCLAKKMFNFSLICPFFLGVSPSPIFPSSGKNL